MNAHEYLAQIILEKKANLLEKGYSKKEVDEYVDSIVEHVSTVHLVGHIEQLSQEERSLLEHTLQKEIRTEDELKRLLASIELSPENTQKMIEDLESTFLHTKTAQ